MDRAKGKSMKLNMIYGLPFVDAVFSHRGKIITASNVLIDTGSATTLLSAEVALELGLEPELTDTIQTMRGIGGKEFVYEKKIDKLTFPMNDIIHTNKIICDRSRFTNVETGKGKTGLLNSLLLVLIARFQMIMLH